MQISGIQGQSSLNRYLGKAGEDDGEMDGEEQLAELHADIDSLMLEEELNKLLEGHELAQDTFENIREGADFDKEEE